MPDKAIADTSAHMGGSSLQKNIDLLVIEPQLSKNAKNIRR